MTTVATGSYRPSLNYAAARPEGCDSSAATLAITDTLVRCECTQDSRPMTQLEMNEQARRS